MVIRRIERIRTREGNEWRKNGVEGWMKLENEMHKELQKMK